MLATDFPPPGWIKLVGCNRRPIPDRQRKRSKRSGKRSTAARHPRAYHHHRGLLIGASPTGCKNGRWADFRPPLASSC